MSAALVMAKAPRAGEVKTRLEPLLGPEGCADLQAALIENAARWAAEHTDAAFVAYTPPDAEDEMRTLVPEDVELFPQEGDDLGERLEAATERVAERPLLVVGTDAPAMRGEHARAALEALGAGADACFGPAVDGGYYLVGLAARTPQVFAIASAAWGGPDVLRLSLDAARAAGLRVELLAEERDLDTPADAEALLARAALPGDVADLLRV